MVETVKKGDFIEVEYTGKINDQDFVFDTTDETAAKSAGIHRPGFEYGPLVICVGEGQVIKGLDETLEGKELGKKYTANIEAAKAFGRKTGDLIRIVPTSTFKKQNIRPVPGLQLDIDGMPGVVKTVSGGRTLVDFNHPLSGKDVHYEFKINKKVNDDLEKVKVFVSSTIGIKKTAVEAKLEQGTATVSMKMKLPDNVIEVLVKKMKELIPSVKEIKFEHKAEKPAAKQEKTQ